jgi:hypothetical protein
LVTGTGSQAGDRQAEPAPIADRESSLASPIPIVAGVRKLFTEQGQGESEWQH